MVKTCHQLVEIRYNFNMCCAMQKLSTGNQSRYGIFVFSQLVEVKAKDYLCLYLYE